MRIDEDDPEADWDDAQRLLYRGELFTGEAAEYTKDNELVALVTYRDGVEDGPSHEWYPDGTPACAGSTRNGLPIGVWKTWARNGQLVKEHTFDEMGRELALRTWTEDGKPETDEQYEPRW